MRNRKRYTSLYERIKDLQLTAKSAVQRSWRIAVLIASPVVLFIVLLVGWKALQSNEHFLLKKVMVIGNKELASEEVIAACGLSIGKTNLLFESVREIAARCENDSRIRIAEIEIMHPDRAVIRIEEQEPVMYVATEQGLFVANGFAEIYAPADITDLRDLPLVLFRSHSDVQSDALRNALALIRTVSRPLGPFANSALLIEYDPDSGYMVSSLGTGLRVRFGEPPFQRKYERLLEALDFASKHQMQVTEVLLDNAVTPTAVTLRTVMTGAIATVRDGYQP